jgi:acetylornithine deacetylase
MRPIDSERIRRAVSQRREQILEWTQRLIRFPTENRPPRGFEAEGQEYLAEECRALGWETELFAPDEVENIENHPSWLAGRDYTNNRKNCVARWPGSGNASGSRSILFSGHMDVAPFEPDNWQVCRPYDPIFEKGRLYGRGAADLKGGLAAAFWALKLLKDLEFEPSGDVLFESVVDEEFAGGNGTLASRLKGYNADLAILTEPTRMEICPACLGAFLGDLTLQGKAGMPYMGTSTPNPIHGASRVIELFKEWQEKWRSTNHHSLFEDRAKELNVMLWSIDSKTPGEFTQMGNPLLTRLSWIVWCHPGMTEEAFYDQFGRFWEERGESDSDLKPFSLELTRTYHYVKPWETAIENPAVQEVIRSYGEYMREGPVVGGAPFSCDLAIYGETGHMPSVILGPRGDNLHAPDEWVLFEDILSLVGIYALLVVRWCGQDGENS